MHPSIGHTRFIAFGIAVTLASGLLAPAAQARSSPAVTVELDGAGSTFIYPLMRKWVATYATVDRSARVRYQPVGSGAGINLFTRKAIDFAATDAPLGDYQIKSAGGDVLHIPLTLGPVAIVYNLPALKIPLRLDGPTLAQIYLGKITSWNDKAIAALNPGLALPNQSIAVVHRSDGSGTTYIFSSYLSTESAPWREAVGSAPTLNWPVGAGGGGNDGVASLVNLSTGGIGYVAFSYAISHHLAAALLRNKAGQFVAPSVAGAVADAANAGQLPADLRATIVDAPGAASYPITGFTWALIHQKASNAVTYGALLKFLWWCTHEGQQLTTQGNLRYAPLPPAVVRLDESKIKSVTYNGAPVFVG